MPRWLYHSKSFLYWRKRFRLNADPQEMLTGVIPVSIVDRSWPDDTRYLWGAFHSTLTRINQHAAVELVAQRRALRIHRITAWMSIGTPPYPWVGYPIHLFTPLQNYDPVPNDTTIGFPWLQTAYRQGQDGALGDAFLLGGNNAAMQTILVNGVPYVSVGPMALAGGTSGAVTLNTKWNESVLWSGQDPPLVVQPFTSICVQTFFAAGATSTYALNASFFYSEDEELA